MSNKIPAMVLGATGYVGGELLRLLAVHPEFKLLAAVSTSQAGQPIAATFSALAPAWPNLAFSAPEDSLASTARRIGGNSRAIRRGGTQPRCRTARCRFLCRLSLPDGRGLRSRLREYAWRQRVARRLRAGCAGTRSDNQQTTCRSPRLFRNSGIAGGRTLVRLFVRPWQPVH